METPTLPEGYFFRVTEGYTEGWGMSHYNARVELRKKTMYHWSTKIGDLAIPHTSNSHPTQQELFDTMVELKAWWENKKAEVLPYGDYPPKKLKDLDGNS